jgi:hypothetical protein
MEQPMQNWNDDAAGVLIGEVTRGKNQDQNRDYDR